MMKKKKTTRNIYIVIKERIAEPKISKKKFNEKLKKHLPISKFRTSKRYTIKIEFYLQKTKSTKIYHLIPKFIVI